MSTGAVIVLAVIVGFILLVWLGYNSLVYKRNLVDNAFALIDTQLKKRCDLIPNLVASVKTYMKHESSTLTAITELRSRAIQPGISDAERVDLNNQITNAMRSIMVQVEQYPDLKATDSFQQLNRSLNEVEEQLSAARRSYNAAVTDYNTAIQSFPSNVLASAFHFGKRELFQIAESERAVPKVGELFQ